VGAVARWTAPQGQTVREITRDRLINACRVYRSTRDAAQAIGIGASSFLRACKRHGVEMPWKRGQRSLTA
jgi:hypothetical protein